MSRCPSPNPVERLVALSILIVDSNQDAADSLSELLKSHGYQTRVSYDAQSALDAEPADVVILELELPGLSGWEVVRWLRSRPSNKRPFYIALTNRYTMEDSIRAAKSGFDMNLLKPVDLPFLVGVLKRFSRLLR